MIIPYEIEGCFIDDKMDKLNNLDFKWKVDLIHIKLNKVSHL